MSPPAPTQAARWPLHPTKVFPEEMELDVRHLGIRHRTGQKHDPQWREGLRNRLPVETGSPRLLLLCFPKASKWADTYHPQSLEETQQLWRKDLYTLTIQKLVDLELTLLGSPPVTRPIHSHRAFQCPTQTYRAAKHLGSQASEENTTKDRN